MKAIDPLIIQQITHINRSNIRQPRRAHVLLGYHCNYKCVFCYNNGKQSCSNFSYEQIIDYLKFLEQYGIEEIEFTGGEPTLHKDFIKILDYTKKYFKKIAIITNGSYSYKFYKQIEPYVDEFLFSFHGYSKESHALITGIDSAWNKLIDSIYYAENKLVRLNITICQYNYAYLFEQAKYIKKSFPFVHIVNYLPMNSWDASILNGDFSVPFYLYRNKLMECIDYLSDYRVSVRYIPFCILSEKYKQNVYGHLQHVYDEYDWNQELDGHTIKSELLDKPYGYYSIDSVLEKRKLLYTKFDFCLKCKNFNICDGFQNNQIEREKYYFQYLLTTF